MSMIVPDFSLKYCLSPNCLPDYDELFEFEDIMEWCKKQIASIELLAEVSALVNRRAEEVYKIFGYEPAPIRAEMIAADGSFSLYWEDTEEFRSTRRDTQIRLMRYHIYGSDSIEVKKSKLVSIIIQDNDQNHFCRNQLAILEGKDV